MPSLYTFLKDCVKCQPGTYSLSGWGNAKYAPITLTPTPAQRAVSLAPKVKSVQKKGAGKTKTLPISVKSALAI